MRNLKKSLALVLAFLMVFGLCTIGAGAAFENETVQYTTPVQVMAGMGILTGNENGVFNPTGELTRAAAAKIVAYVALGKTAAEMMTAAEDFKDLKVSDPQYGWSVKYVHYLFTKGIVVGYGDGNYGPGDSVTVLQFAKMLLCAIGYGKQNEFVGPGWDANTLVKAIEVDMLLGLNSTDTDRVITREEASLFAFNTMTQAAAGVVTYSTLTNSYSTPVATDRLGLTKYKYATATAVVTENQATGNKYTVVDGKSFNVTTDKSLIGHLVTVYYNSTAVAGAYNVYSYVDIGTVKTYAGGPGATLAAALGVPVSTATTWYKFTNYDDALGTVTPGDADLGTYVLDGFGKIVAYLLNTTYEISQVTAINTTAGSESITLAGAGLGLINNKASDDKIVEYTGIAKNDYVTVVKIGNIYYLTKATTAEGKITSYKPDMSSISLDGTAYSKIAATTTDNQPVAAEIATAAGLDFTNTFVLYLDEFGKFFAVTKKTAEIASNLFYYTSSYTKNILVNEAVVAANYAKGINAAGEVVSFKYATAPAAANALYNVTVGGDGNATFGALTGTGAIGITSLAGWPLDNTKLINKLTAGGSNYYLASDAKIIYVNDKLSSPADPTVDTYGTAKAPTVTVTTGIKEAITLDADDYIVTTRDGLTNNYTVTTIIREGTAGPAVANAASLIYATAKDVNGNVIPASVKASVPYTTAYGVATANLFDVYIDGVKTEIKTASTTTSIAVGFHSYSVDANGIYTVTAAVNTNAAQCANGTFANYYNGRLSFGTVTDVAATNAVVLNVSGNTKAPTTVDTLAATEDIAVVYGAGGVVAYIYITACSR